jgi:hypothetical protein
MIGPCSRDRLNVLEEFKARGSTQTLGWQGKECVVSPPFITFPTPFFSQAMDEASVGCHVHSHFPRLPQGRLLCSSNLPQCYSMRGGFCLTHANQSIASCHSSSPRQSRSESAPSIRVHAHQINRVRPSMVITFRGRGSYEIYCLPDAIGRGIRCS